MTHTAIFTLRFLFHTFLEKLITYSQQVVITGSTLLEEIIQ